MRYKKIIMESLQRIYLIINELQNIEQNEFEIIQSNQLEILRKIDKLQEYNEIDDMATAIMDRRLSKIEKNL